jgi:long-chain fatty acid transport protein
MRFAVPLAYKNSGFSIAISPILQYGSLSIAYNAGQNYTDAQGTSHNTMTGRGVSQDFGFGYNFGIAYEVSGFTIGAIYTSAISMTYDHQISEASKQFGLNQGKGLSDDLEQPAEYGIGLSYTMGEHTIAADYKRIAWSSADGYKDFKWEDQDVMIIGYQYATKKWAIRLGYNYASNPIKEQSATNFTTPGEYDGAVINYFNSAGFPATVESHYTLGASYQINEKIGVDFAYTYAPEVTDTYDTSALTQAKAGGVATISSEATIKHSQQGVTLAMTIKF